MNDRLRTGTARVGQSLRDAMQTLERSGHQIVLVVDDTEKLIGTLTDGDIRRALLSGETLEAPLLPHVSKKFISVKPESTRTDVLELMQARWVNQIPIVDGAGKLVGLHLLREMVGSLERPEWAVIMAGGKGSRLWPLTQSLPKPMLPVAGKPILERLVHHLVGFGFRRIFISVHYLAEVIERHFGNGSKFGCSIEYLREEMPLGTGGALSLLPETPVHPVLTMNGDLVVQFNVARLFETHSTAAAKATVAVHNHAYTVPFGVMDIQDGRVVDVQEKPTFSWATNAGIYVLAPELIARVPRATSFPLPSLIEECLARKEIVQPFFLNGDWIDVGRSPELARARGDGGSESR